MVRGNVHQDGDIGAELIHIVQLEGAEFDNIIVVLLHGHLQGKAVADVACQPYIQSRTLEDVVMSEVVVVLPLEPVMQIILAFV